MGATGFRVSGALRRSVAQRLLYALSRFGDGVERVAVGLSDEKNAFGGVDRHCRMRAWLKHHRSVSVATMDGPGAVDRAAERLAVRVEWALVDGRAELSSGLTPAALPAPARKTSAGHEKPAPRAAAKGRGTRRT